MGFLPLFFLLYHLAGIPEVTSSKIPSTQQCADQKCIVPLSQGKTVLRYIADDPRVLSFTAGEDVVIYSKAQDYYGAKIRGRFGFVPRTFVRETKILEKELPFTVSTDNEENSSVESSKTVPASSMVDDHTPLNTLQQIEKLTQAHLQQKSEVFNSASSEQVDGLYYDEDGGLEPSVPVAVEPYFTTTPEAEEVSSTTAFPILSNLHRDVLSESDLENGDHGGVPGAVPEHEDAVLSPHEKLGVDPYVNSNIVENTYHPDANELLGAASKEVPVILEDFSNNLNVNFPETGFSEPEVKNLDSEVEAKLEEIVNASAESVFNSSLEEGRNNTEQLDQNLNEKTFGINDIKPLLTTFDSSPNEGLSEAELDLSGEEDQDEEDEDEAEDAEEGQEEGVDLPPELESQQQQTASESAPADDTPASVETESLVPHDDTPERQPDMELSSAEDEVVHEAVPEEVVKDDEITEMKAAEEAEVPEERGAVEVALGEADNQGKTGEASGFLSKLTSFFSSEAPPEQSVESTEEPVKDEKAEHEQAAREQDNPIEVPSSVENQEVSTDLGKGIEAITEESGSPIQFQEDKVKMADVNENLIDFSHPEPTLSQEVYSPETDAQEREKETVQVVPDQKADDPLQHVDSKIAEDHHHDGHDHHDHAHGHSHNHGHSHHHQHDHRHSHSHYGHGHSHSHHGHGHSHHGHGHSHSHGHGHGHSHNHDHGHNHNYDHGDIHDPIEDHGHGDLNNEITHEHSDVNDSDHNESHQHTIEDHSVFADSVEHQEPVISSADVFSGQLTQNVVDNVESVLTNQITEDSVPLQTVTETPPEVPDIVNAEFAQQPSMISESADRIVAPDGYCDADGQICGTATTAKPSSRFLLEDEPSIAEDTQEEEGMLSEVLLPPRSELIAILTSVGIVVAIFLVLSQVVKTCAGRAKLVERVNRVESQLVVSLEQISCLQSERGKFKGKESELRSKLLVAEESCKELGEKTQLLEVEKAKESAAKKELEKKFEDVVQVSNEQGTMQAELLAMQEELLQQKAELEALLQSKEEECDHYRREATEIRELLSSIELQLSSATDKAAQFESAEKKCAELLNEKCELQINIQNLKEENSLLQSSLIEKASEAQSLRVVLEKVESRGGSLPSGSLDDLMDAAKIKAELDSTREEYETLKNELATLNNEHAESKRIAEELRTTVQQLEYQLTTATDERNKAEDSLKILTDFFEKQKKELAEKLKLYEDTKGNSASLMQRFEKELELAKSDVGSLQAQVEMYKKALEDQERSLKAEIKAETQRSVEAQLITKNWQRRCEAALREAADLRRRVTELTALNESASRNASMTGSENDLPLLNGGLEVLPPPPFPFPHSMPFPPFAEGLPPLPLDPALMERPTTLGMRSPPFGQPYYEDRGTPNSFRAYSPRSRSPSGSERSEDFRRYRDSYRPESVGRSRDPSPLREYDRRRRDRTPPRHRV